MFEIIGVYQGNKEVIDSAETKEGARYLVNEYRIAFGQGWSISFKRA